MPVRRRNPVRVLALLLAIGINALYLLLLSLHRSMSPPAPVAPAMIWLAASERPRATARRAAPTRPSRAMAPAQVVEPAPQPQPQTQPVPDGPTPAPWIDWRAEARKSAQDFSRERQQDGQEPSSDATAEVRVRPESGWIPRKAGTVEHFEGGVLREWTSDLCYREYNPMEPDPFTGGFRKGGRQVCKKRTMSERSSEARAEGITDAVKQKRSGTAPADKDKEVDQWIP